MWGEEDNSGSEHEEDVEDIDTLFKPTFVVIAIDTHALMFRKNENSSSPFRDCLSACHVLADSLLLIQNKRSWNQFAILVTREESPCLVEFNNNLIGTVKFLKAKANLPDKQLTDEFQRKGNFDLAEFFLTCKKVFHDLKTPFYKRTLIYITDDDEPVQDASKKFTVLNEIKTFSGSQIDFQVITTRPDFDYSKFYNELFSQLDNPPVEEICEDKEGLIEKLTSAVVMRQIRRKIIFYPFKGNTSNILKCYKLDFIHSSNLNNTRLTRDGKAVKLTAEDGDESVDVSYYFRNKAVGSDSIKFDLYEKASLMNNTLPLGLTLLYVSKRSTEIGYILGKPFLLQPQEKDDEYFKKFWQCCVEKDRVLVCFLKQRQPGKIRYTELVPVRANGSPLFLVKYIPFATEMAPPKELDYAEYELSEKKKEAIRKIVGSLTFDFDLKMIPDPCYQKKKGYVKAKLLDEQEGEVMGTAFNIEALDKQLKEPVDIINTNFSLEGEKKRKAPSGTQKPRKSRKN